MQKNLLLVIDIGNTNTVFGVFDPNDDTPKFHKRTVTRRDRTSDELGVFLKGFFNEENIDSKNIGHAIYSSVVPGFNPIVSRMLEDWFNVNPMSVSYTMNLPFSIQYPRPFEIGADRLVNAAAVAKLYSGKKIIIDMGTATTFCVLNEKLEYLGGLIAPGLKISMDSLIRNTAQLPPIVFQTPKKVLGDSTIESLQAGFFFGYIGLIEGIINEIKREYGNDYQVIGTGGLITLIHNARKDLIEDTDPLLTLKGLKYLYEMNSNPSLQSKI